MSGHGPHTSEAPTLSPAVFVSSARRRSQLVCSPPLPLSSKATNPPLLAAVRLLDPLQFGAADLHAVAVLS
ncbi:unnamed protein product [Urochloa humidicola]